MANTCFWICATVLTIYILYKLSYCVLGKKTLRNPNLKWKNVLVNKASFSPKLNFIKDKENTFRHLQLQDKNPLALSKGQRCASITSEENVLK